MTDFAALGLPADLPELAPPNVVLGGATQKIDLSPKQKAAVVVRALLSDGGQVSLSDLPKNLQADLARALGDLDRIDKSIEKTVVSEFLAEMDN